MAAKALARVVRYLTTTLRREKNESDTDGDLLRRFVQDRDELAFEALLRRHAAMVFSVCRRTLGNEADAEDAFQATFLVFVRRAHALRSPGMVGNWLYGVAVRTALEARRSASRRRTKEAQAMPRTETDGPAPDLRAVLDQELARLPSKYRSAVVLCDLEGRTRAAAAAELDCAEGTVASRLARGRALLAKRLTQRGVAVSATALAAALTEQTAAAGMPLLAGTLQAATLLNAGQAVTAVVSTRVVALMEGVMKAMLLTKLKIGAVLVVASMLAGGVGLAVYESGAGLDPASGRQPQQQLKAPEQKRRLDFFGDPLPDGALARLGSDRLMHNAKTASFSADGKTLASAGNDGKVRFWETATGKAITSFAHEAKSSSSDRAVAFSPDGKTLASAADGSLALWEVDTGKQLHSWEGHEKGIRSIVFSPDGKTMASASADQTARLWDVNTAKEIGKWKSFQPIASVVFAPNSATVACACEDRSIWLWDAATGKDLLRLQDPTKATTNGKTTTLGKPSPTSVAFSPDGKMVVAVNRITIPGKVSKQGASATTYSAVLLWEAATGKEVRQFDHQGGVDFVAFASDAKTLFTASPSLVRCWDLTTGTELSQWKVSSNRSIALSPDGKVLAEIGSSIRLLEAATGKVVIQPDRHQGGIKAVAFDASGKTVATAGGDKTVRLWDAATGKQLHLLDAGREVSYLVFVSEAKTVATFVPSGSSEDRGSYHLRSWDVASGKELTRYLTPGSQGGVTISPDGMFVAVRSKDNPATFSLRDAASNKEVMQLEGFNTSVAFLGFTPDSKRLIASGSHDPPSAEMRQMHVSILDVASGKKVGAYQLPESLRKLVLSPDGKTLAYQAQSPSLAVVWCDVATGKELRRFERKTEGSVLFSPDGKSLWFAPAQKVKDIADRPLPWGVLLDMDTGKELIRYTPGSRVVAIAPNGRTLATVDHETVLIWPVTS